MSKKDTFNAGPIVLDVIGHKLTRDDIRRIEHPKTGGVILFGRNFKNRKQLTQLTHAIKKIRQDLLISIDHEGGRVQRCRTDGFTHLPAMKRLGDIWAHAGKKAEATNKAVTASSAAAVEALGKTSKAAIARPAFKEMVDDMERPLWEIVLRLI